MQAKIELGLMAFLLISGGSLLTGLGSLVLIMYYTSMLKINVVDKKYKSSWRLYFKSWFVFLKKFKNIFKKKK